MDGSTTLERGICEAVADNPLMAEIDREVNALQEARRNAISSAAEASRALISLGGLFVQAQTSVRDFENVMLSRFHFSRETIAGCVRAKRKYGDTDPAQMEFSAIKDLLLSAGILPPMPAPQETEAHGFAWWTPLKRFNSDRIASLSAEDRDALRAELQKLLALVAAAS